MSELLAFTTDQVARLTALSKRQLGYWSATEFFKPKIGTTERGRPFGRIYSFRDVVGLRVIAILRNEYQIPLQELRKVGAELAAKSATPWASLHLYVGGRRIFFEDPESGSFLAARSRGQTVLPVDVQRIAHDVSAAADRLRARTPEQVGRVVQNRWVVHNEPVVAGTRIPTIAVWNLREAGYSTEDIIREYPRLTAKDVEAAIRLERSRRQTRRRTA